MDDRRLSCVAHLLTNSCVPHIGSAGNEDLRSSAGLLKFGEVLMALATSWRFVLQYLIEMLSLPAHDKSVELRAQSAFGVEVGQ
jgi:hypothetical protein